MFEHRKIQGLNDFFMELDSRKEKGVYFYRINGFNEEIREFIGRYYEAARLSGVVIEGRIPNPDERNLSYYNEIMGMDFQMSMGFITSSLRKWLPRMNDFQRNQVAASMYDSLDSLRRAGKNENMLKNAYIKFMCWLYYKFERIVNQLGGNRVPKILYEGEISSYELMLVSILSHAGCDVVLLQYRGDDSYRRLDAPSALSDSLALPEMEAFPEGFCIRSLREQMQQKAEQERLYGKKPQAANCTNAWISGEGLADITLAAIGRGSDPKLFYNCFIRMNGAEDKLIYMNELYQFYLELKNAKRRLVIVDGGIPQPDMQEIGEIRRKNYQRQDQMLMDLSANIRHGSEELQRIMVRAFIDMMLEEAKNPGMNLNRLTNKAVYLLCWLKRYQGVLFGGWRLPEISCFIHMGACQNENEALFLRFLARLPVDVLVLNPNLNIKCCLEDRMLYEINYQESVTADKFPQESSGVRIGTAAYHAERELDTLMYQNSGMYRNQQYRKANAVMLQTMYEEIALLWDQELRFRPSFDTLDDVVSLPVIFAKVSGVKNRDVAKYWSGIKALLTEDTLLIQDVPYIAPTDANPFKAYATEFFRNGKVQKEKIKAHQTYRYGVLREEIQEHMLDKLQLLIDRREIKGTFENGTEYTIVSVALNLGKEVVRLIQKFDFTKKNPKIVYINTGERPISLEDSIVTAYLSMLGFDVVFFVPTGYQSVEQYFVGKFLEEHQIGDYLYDLQVPDFRMISLNTRPTWRDKFFKRGI